MTTPFPENVIRKDAYLKVSGQALYTADLPETGTLCARLCVSRTPHGNLRGVDVSQAEKAPGVVAVIIGSDALPLTGVLLQDRPALACGRVRYVGEPLAAVVAQTEAQAQFAASLVRPDIAPLPMIDTPETALAPGATALHPASESYPCLVDDVHPQRGTNIAASFSVRKGDPAAAFAACAQTAEMDFTLPQSAHAFLETRTAAATLRADGTLLIETASQSPYTVQALVAGFLHLEPGQVEVQTPFVGGGYGGKSAVMLEYIAALCAARVPGRRVRVVLPREQDFTTPPARLGLKAHIKLGCDAAGRLLAGEMRFTLDCGAYSDISPNMSKAIAADCTGPYRLENLSVDSLTVYTNHPYATAFRGFAHESCAFCTERAMDALARKAGLDPIDFRLRNALRPGDLSPTRVEVTPSNLGNPVACLEHLREMTGGCRPPKKAENGNVRATGVALTWKQPTPATDADAAATLTFNDDGSVNLQTGVVEMGNGAKTVLSQMAAERLRMDYNRIHVSFPVDTRRDPRYFKTVASLSSFLAGKAVLHACDDALEQLRARAAVALRCEKDELDYNEERFYVLSNPRFAIGFQDVCGGLSYQDGNSVMGPVVGRGCAVLRHLGPLSQDTGAGNVGHAWTCQAQAVEVEFDPKDCSYRLVRAFTAMDAGPLTDESASRAMVMGGMSQGLSLAREETLDFMPDGASAATSLRAYHPLRIGEEPRYAVEFLHTPQKDAPFGARSHTEHGILGMPAALGNALSAAANVPLNALPLTPEAIFTAKGGAPQ